MKEREIEMYNGKVFGKQVSEYGLENGYLDYKTLAEIVGDMILCNDIVKLMYGGAEISVLDNYQSKRKTLWFDIENGSEYEEDSEYGEEPIDIYQYYIISGYGAEILKKYTEEIVWYNEELDIYVWGITHFGTSWSYVLTDIKLKEIE